MKITIPSDPRTPERAGEPWYVIRYSPRIPKGSDDCPRFQRLTDEPLSALNNDFDNDVSGLEILIWVQGRSWSVAKQRARWQLHHLRRRTPKMVQSGRWT